jgi:hypothetical protein
LWLTVLSTWPAAPGALQVRAAEPAISLAGDWQFQLDRHDVGVAERWFERSLEKRLQLPGALQAQGFGDIASVNTQWTGLIIDRSWFTAPEYARYRVPGNIKVPFWLQPDRHYVGPAWYQRTFEVPPAWKDKRLVLTLERPHWETRVWLDGRCLGCDTSLSTPHVYSLGTAVPPGQHRLTIRVDNRLIVNVGENAHSVSDHTQSNWNGIVGRITVAATEPVALEDLQVFPRTEPPSIHVEGKIANATARAGRGQVRLSVVPVSATERNPLAEKSVMVEWTEKGGTFETDCLLRGRVELWDEFQPSLYELRAVLVSEPSAPGAGQKDDVGASSTKPLPGRSVRFGLREIGTKGTQFVINGRKVFFRGTLECCIFPRTGYPPTDMAEWKRIIGVARAHGVNQMRFHSWCPPEAAFAAADEMGFYFLVECAAWTEVGKGKPIDRWLYAEADRILAAYGNHPSFVLMSSGNEPSGEHRRYLAEWVEHYKKRDSRRLYTSASGWPQLSENQFHLAPDPRVQAWGAGLRSRINARPPETTTDYRNYIQARKVPVISHEIGQWCVYPNFEEVSRYTGYLKPKNFEIFRDSLAAHHMADQARPFLLASGKLQTLCYKEDIESALRTPGMGGFQLLDLHDFPGQGTALIGVLDPFWESKGYVTAGEFSRFCNRTVPLARLPKRVFTVGETLQVDVEMAHFGPRPLRRCRAVWKLVDEKGTAVACGALAARDVPVDNGVTLGSIRLPLEKFRAPDRYRLVIGLEETSFENDWDLWLYPAAVPTQAPESVLIAHALTPAVRQRLQAGGKVLLLPDPVRVKGDIRGKVALGFSSIFWNTAWTRRQAPHTLGILCDPKHPALAQFPTEYHSNWQWWYLLSQAQPMILDALPAELRPVVQVIDDWFTNRRLGLVFEAKVGGGKLLVASIDLRKKADSPVARQMLHSLQAYAGSDRFEPQVVLAADQVTALFAEP